MVVGSVLVCVGRQAEEVGGPWLAVGGVGREQELVVELWWWQEGPDVWRTEEVADPDVLS